MIRRWTNPKPYRARPGDVLWLISGHMSFRPLRDLVVVVWEGHPPNDTHRHALSLGLRGWRWGFADNLDASVENGWNGSRLIGRVPAAIIGVVARRAPRSLPTGATK